VSDIKDYTQKKLNAGDMEVNIYLEDWSNGMIHSEEYVYYLLDSLKDENIQRFMLPILWVSLIREQTFEFL